MCMRVLQLCPENDCEQGETDGSGESQVNVQQHGEDEGDHPDHLAESMAVNSRQHVSIKDFLVSLDDHW